MGVAHPSVSGVDSWLAHHHPDPQTRPRQDRLLHYAEAEMLVGRHVAWDRCKELAAYPLRIRASGHVPHEGAADAPPLLARLDAEPVEVPMRLRREWPEDIGDVGGERLVARERLSAPRCPNFPPSRSITIRRRDRGMRGGDPAGDPAIGAGVTQTSPRVSPMRCTVSSICGTPAARCFASGKA